MCLSQTMKQVKAGSMCLVIINQYQCVFVDDQTIKPLVLARVTNGRFDSIPDPGWKTTDQQMTSDTSKHMLQ